MSKFDIRKKLSLDFLGDGWEECYLIFSTPSIAELSKSVSGLENLDAENPKGIQENFERAMEMIENNFIEGKGLVGGKVVDVKKVDLREFPIDVINRVMDFLASGSVMSE